MCQINRRYPELRIRSKNELAKRLSSKKFPKEKALDLINDVLKDHGRFWHDVKSCSEPDKGKFVRSCKGTKLGRLLWLIDKKILASQDCLAPEFVFGGIEEKNHVKAVCHLLGKQRKRTLLKLDISTFFEQNKYSDVYNLFKYKCKCGARVASIFADLCCVPEGPKDDNVENEMILARGFATSSRLALWCNLYPFLRIYWKTGARLKNNDPRMAIFVDDIGITGSRVTNSVAQKLTKDIEIILDKYELPINKEKTKIITYKDQDMEQLGLKLGRNKITLGEKSRDRYGKIKNQLKRKNLSQSEKQTLLKKKKSYDDYIKYIKRINREMIKSGKI